FFSSRRRHTRSKRDWSSDVCSSDLAQSRTRRTALRAPRDVLLPTLPRANRRSGRRASAVSSPESSGRFRSWDTSGPLGSPHEWRSEERRVGKEGREGWWAEQSTERG